MRGPKHIGFTGITIPRIPVVIWDEMPFPFPFALFMTSQQFAAVQASNGMAIRTEGIELAKKQGIPTNHAPITVERDFRFPPEPSKWTRTPDGDVILGCPKCGTPAGIKAPPFAITPEGYLEPSFICQRCKLHCMIRLGEIRFDPEKCTTCGCPVHRNECETEKGGKPCGCFAGTPDWEPEHVEHWPPNDGEN